MSSNSRLTKVKNQLLGIDWPLLIFLILFLNVKLVIKLAALLFIYIIRSRVNLKLSLTNPRLPLFYFAVISIAVFNFLLYGGFVNLNYSIAVLVGIGFWLMCLLASHQLKTAVETIPACKIHQTIFALFIINAIVSLVVYGSIIIETGAVNPYRYQGQYQKYFIGTGDYIKGISFDTSTTNAVLNAFAILYFLAKEKFAWCLFFMAVLLLTGSNITNMILGGVFLLLFIFKSTKTQKSIIVACFGLLVIFLAKVSPQNNSYIETAYEKFIEGKKPQQAKAVKEIPVTEKPDSILTAEERKQKVAINYLDSVAAAKTKLETNIATLPKEKPEIPQANIHTPPYQHKDDTTGFQKELMVFMEKDKIDTPVPEERTAPGKVTALKEVVTYLWQHPAKIITGCGICNFSSKLAFKATGLKIAGGYPERFKYINPAFEKNHLALYLGYFTKTAGQHSVINKPDSVYGQLLGEYGIAGIAALIIFYFGFFSKHLKTLTYGLPLLVFTAGLFFSDYWFEQLSVMTVFELLLFLNIKETTGQV